MSPKHIVLSIIAICMIGTIANAQKIVYVRDSGNDAADGLTESTANSTIEGAIGDAVAGDIVDVGPGTFTGASIPFSLTIRGANSGADLALWGEPTIIRSPFVVLTSDAPVEASFDGLTFGQIVPVEGKSPGAIVSVSFCMFNVSKPLSTEGLEWSELVVVGCLFKGRIKDVSSVAEHAVIASGVSVAYMAESRYSDYSSAAVYLKGIQRVAKLQYNEFTNCNSSGARTEAAVRFDCDAQEIEAEIQKNLLTNCKNGIVTNGSLAGRQVSVQYNKFVSIPTDYLAIRNTGTGTLTATCNALQLPLMDPPPDKSSKIQLYTKLFSGDVQAFPLNDIADDSDGSAIGFEPDKAQQCAFVK